MVTILQERTSAERAYQRKVDELLGAHARLTDATVRDVVALLARVRNQLVADLLATTAPDGSWERWRLSSLITAIDRAVVEFHQEYSRTLRSGTTPAWDAGSLFAPDALAAANIRFSVAPSISRLQLEVAEQLQADLVQRVTQSFRQGAAREVTLAVAGVKSPWQAQQAIQELLRTQPHRRTRQMGPIASQAERIVRTEMMSVFNLADQVRHEELAVDVPALRQTWNSAGDGRTRPDHADASHRYRAGGDPGPIAMDGLFRVGGESCRMPHDPALSAGQRINCRCVRGYWHPDWDS